MEDEARGLGEVFDPKREWVDHPGMRPHWAQAGTIVFITMSAIDALPRAVLELWEREKAEWLAVRGHREAGHWSVVVPTLSPAERTAFQTEFRWKKERELDTCHGRCLLRRPELAEIVVNTLRHFDGDRYRLGDFVVMPNHLHLLAVFPDAETMRDQCASWSRYSARRIRKALGERGAFWREEPFDHLVRSGEQYEYLRRYIAENPLVAGLREGEFVSWRREG
jgi:putative transposase